MAGHFYYGAQAFDEGFHPRFPASPIAEKQLKARDAVEGNCAAGLHTCQDVNRPGDCCPNTHYCYINTTSHDTGCCSIGNDCTSNICPLSLSQYFCLVTSTASPSIIGTTSHPPTTSTAAACCQRPCDAAHQHQCPGASGASTGGNCCALGFACLGSTACATTIAPTNTLVGITPNGCQAGQIACASASGGGCCNAGSICTYYSGTTACASATAAPTDSNGALISGIAETSAGGLSSGAKAGIGAGIGVLACVLIGAITFFYIKRKRSRTSAAGGASESLTGSQGMSQAGSGAGRRRGGGGGGGGSGGGRDYFGPPARVGPYTHAGEDEVISPLTAGHRGVPVRPLGPGDIVPAVEIGGGERTPGESNIGSNVGSTVPSNVVSPVGESEVENGRTEYFYAKEVPEKAEHRVELP